MAKGGLLGTKTLKIATSGAKTAYQAALHNNIMANLENFQEDGGSVSLKYVLANV